MKEKYGRRSLLEKRNPQKKRAQGGVSVPRPRGEGAADVWKNIKITPEITV